MGRFPVRPVNRFDTLRPYRVAVKMPRGLDTTVTRRYRRHMTDEERHLREALEAANGSPTGAARILGVTRMTVWRRMKKYGVEIKRVAA